MDGFATVRGPPHSARSAPSLFSSFMKKATAGTGAVRTLVDALDYAFNRRSWHGANLMGAVRGASLAEAAVRVSGRRSVWEQVLHAAYWKHRVLTIVGQARHGPLGRKGSNWLEPPAPPSEAAWREDLALLKALHAKLRTEVLAIEPRRLDRKLAWLIHGAAAHDLYHAGQIKLLRRLIKERGAESRAGNRPRRPIRGSAGASPSAVRS